MQQTPFDFIESMFEEADEERSFPRIGISGEMRAAIDVAEEDGEFIVTCDLPGFDEEDIDIRVTDHTLHIQAEHEAEEEVEEENYIHRERRRTDVSRSIPLPEEVDVEDVSASYEDGVLRITLPKEHAEEEEAHKIPLS